ncbi:MAG: M20/M25/M40 family metallo-hydrolase [Gemmatimonadales bacterium]
MSLPLILPSPPASAQQAPAATVAREIDVDVLDAHLALLADDALEGRGTGQRGAELAAKYLAAQFTRLGLEPVADGGTYYQRIPLLGRTATPALRIGGDSLAPVTDFVAYAAGRDSAAAVSGEPVFVGYGIVASEEQWDDYAGADVRGKIVLALAGTPADQDSALFRNARGDYGFRQYKVNEAMRQGAVAAFVIYHAGAVPVPWPSLAQSWAGEQVQLDRPPESGALRIGGWLNEPAARKLLERGNADFATLLAAAAKPGFRAVGVAVRLESAVATRTRTIPAVNVVGRLPGRGRLAQEAVVLGAHYDHLGVGAPVAGDSIYNGAFDNASGTAGMLAVAEAFVRSGVRPARSVLFVGFGAEEHGLLGSEAFVARPPVPLGRIAAMVNLDAVALIGESRDLAALGSGESSLGEVFRAAAAAEGYRLTPADAPVLVEAEQQDFFNRSDQAPFARAGVPALFLYGAPHDFVGEPAGWGKEQLDHYLQRHYHQPSDELTLGLDPRFGVRPLRVVARTLLAAANLRTQPTWAKSSPYREAGERRVDRQGVSGKQ